MSAAAGPASPASWLFDIALAGAFRAGGFPGLRWLHALAVLGVLGLAFAVFRRASASIAGAACGTALFAVLAAYRLFQLRPELFTIAATSMLFAVLIMPRPDRRSHSAVATAFVLGMLWANLHAGFLLAPILLGAAAVGVAGARLLQGCENANTTWRRARGLALASVASAIGGLINPRGYEAYSPYLASGASTPTLTVVYDEWTPLGLLRLPSAESMPNVLDWLLLWGLLLGTLAGITVWLLRGRNADAALRQLDPALIAVTCASWVAIMTAVRFQWLAIFPLLLVVQIENGRDRRLERLPSARAWAPAIVALMLVPAFLVAGSWPMLARGLPTTRAGYSAPYAIGKHPGHAAWLLRDAGLRGNLFALYPSGGFLGFWLAPNLRVLANGSLNIEPESMQAYLKIQQRQGTAGQSFEATLESQEIDVFLGSNLPGYRPNRSRPFTTTHLERASSWVLVFRNLRSAIWLRKHPRNEENFRHIASYYATRGVPFDASDGFDLERASSEAPQWAFQNGLVPNDLLPSERAARSDSIEHKTRALTRLAGIRASLGQYEQALDLDARLLGWRPKDRGALQRRLWCLLHLDRAAEAVGVADELESLTGDDGLSSLLALSARRYAAAEDPGERAAIVSLLPLFTRDQASRLTRGFSPPPLRTERDPMPL